MAIISQMKVITFRNIFIIHAAVIGNRMHMLSSFSKFPGKKWFHSSICVWIDLILELFYLYLMRCVFLINLNEGTSKCLFPSDQHAWFSPFNFEYRFDLMIYAFTLQNLGTHKTIKKTDYISINNLYTNNFPHTCMCPESRTMP